MLANGGTNLGGRARLFANSLSDMSVGVSPDEALGILAEERDRLRGDKTKNLGSGGIGGPGSYTTVKASVEDRAAADRLDKLIESMQKTLEATRETNRLLNNGGIPVSNN